MDRNAVDIVLLPPVEIMDLSIELNRILIKNNPPKIELNKENCIPHISLSMGVLKDTDKKRFMEELYAISEKHNPLQLRTTGIYTVEIPNSEKVSGIAIENSKELYALHTDVMKLSSNYLTNDATLDTVYSPPSVDEVTLQFINKYPSKSAYENFNPHITLGVGELRDPEFDMEFTSWNMALYHLGNYCTCRKRLFDIYFPAK